MITLTFGSRVVQISRFADKRLPRVRVNPAAIDYNASGSPVLRGSQFEAKFLWSINALLTPEEYGLLQLIYGESEAARRQFLDPTILLDDQTEQIYESARSRALVPGTGATDLVGAVAYYARFGCFFVRPPEGVEAGNYYQVQASLAELEVIDD